MANRAPAQTFRAIVIGGVLFGVVLIGLGVYYLDDVFHQGANQSTYLPLALTFFSLGAAFIFVAGIVLPALRVLRLENGNRP